VLKRARDEAERGWRGEDAAIWFRVGLDGDGRNAARLARDAERVARVLETYADNLAHAQDLVQQARDEALEAGLVVRDAVIYYPDEGVTAPAAAPPADAQQWARTVNEHRIAAYQHTSALVFQANDLLSDTGLESLVDELWGNRYFMTGDMINGQSEVLARWYEGKLDTRSGDLAKKSGYLRDWRDLITQADAPDIAREADRLATEYADGGVRARSAARGMGLIARLSKYGTGPGISVFGIYFDYRSGTSPEKAVIKGIAGFAGSAAFIGLFAGPPGWVGALVVGIGVLAGAGASWLAGYAYDHWLPETVKGRAEDYVQDRLEAGAQARREQQEAIQIHKDLLREKLEDTPPSPQYGWDDRRDWQEEEDGS
jgi:hypothetical protein